MSSVDNNSPSSISIKCTRITHQISTSNGLKDLNKNNEFKDNCRLSTLDFSTPKQTKTCLSNIYIYFIQTNP